jgi:ribosomal protein L16 Arg81 hydroxylase
MVASHPAGWLGLVSVNARRRVVHWRMSRHDATSPHRGVRIQFRFVDVAFPKIADVRAALSRAARQVLKVTLFISAKGAGVLDAHYDSNPVGIVPLFGTKLWKVGCRSVVRHPFAEVSRLNGRELLACKPNAVTLGQGSVLFAPGGHPVGLGYKILVLTCRFAVTGG